MGILSGHEPEGVMHFFEDICAIPHGSGNTKGISDYLVKFASARGLEYIRDEADNVIIIKPATPGYENAEPVIIQGHTDMVCEKTPDSDHDFARDALKLAFDGEWIYAENTTLGGDNGAAVAMALALLDDDTIEHPRLEIVLTTDEETGLCGAKTLDMSRLTAKRLINLDSEDEGIVTVSCAGGARAQCVRPVSREPKSGTVFTVSIGGLLGGHSGVDINLGRASANKLMGRFLHEASKQIDLRLIALEGGTVDNAISNKATAEVLVPTGDAEIFAKIASEFDLTVKNEYKTTDPDVFVSVSEKLTGDADAVTSDDTDKIIYMLAVAPQGVREMSADIEGLVQTSLNMGVIKLSADKMTQVFSVRSSVSSQKYMLLDELSMIMKRLGGSADIYNEYPAWEYRKDSELRSLMTDVYEEMFGKKMQIAATHGGLECGIFCGKMPELDCVSVGPDISDVHSVKERMNIFSVQRTWKYMLEVLKRMK